MTRKTQKHFLTVVNPHCAGIDIGARDHWVAIDPDQGDPPVRCFSTFSDDLYACADWLAATGVEVVAMEATGVYRIPLFEVLDELPREYRRLQLLRAFQPRVRGRCPRKNRPAL